MHAEDWQSHCSIHNASQHGQVALTQHCCELCFVPTADGEHFPDRHNCTHLLLQQQQINLRSGLRFIAAFKLHFLQQWTLIMAMNSCCSRTLLLIAEGEQKADVTRVTELHWAHKLPNHKLTTEVVICILVLSMRVRPWHMYVQTTYINVFETQFGTMLSGKFWALLLTTDLRRVCPNFRKWSTVRSQLKLSLDSHPPQKFCSVHKLCLQPVLSWWPPITDANNAMPIVKWHSARILLQLSCCSRRTHSARLSSVTALLKHAPCTLWLQEALNAVPSRHHHNFMLCKA